MNEKYDFEQYSGELMAAFRSHGDAWAMLCLRDDGSVWKLSFKTLVRYIEDFALATGCSSWRRPR